MGDHYCCDVCYNRYDDCTCTPLIPRHVETKSSWVVPKQKIEQPLPMLPDMEDVEYFFNKFVKRADQKSADQLIEAVKLYMKEKS